MDVAVASRSVEPSSRSSCCRRWSPRRSTCAARGRSRGAGQPVPVWRRFLFWTGIALVVLALNSPIDALGEEHFFFVHMLQHVLLGDLAPLCFVAGLTGPILRPVLAFSVVRAAPRPDAPVRRAARLGRQPLRLARPVPLRRCAAPRRGARARAHALLHLRLPDVGAGARDAAGAGLVRHRREDRLHLLGAADRDGARQRLHLVELDVLHRLPPPARVGDHAGARPEPRRDRDDGRGLDRHARRRSPGSSCAWRPRASYASGCSSRGSTRAGAPRGALRASGHASRRATRSGASPSAPGSRVG